MIQKPSNIPKNPGIYIFKNAKGQFLYVGKASSLKQRLASYFVRDILDRVRKLREEAASLSFEILESEFEALVREAELIKKYRPKFNILMRDDKAYYYVTFTRETFPRIIVTHQPLSKTGIIGPFTEGGSLFAVLKLLRKSFPYCTCKKPHARPCINAELGRCFGFCCISNHAPTALEKRQYARSIAAIRGVLSGKARSIVADLKHSMATVAREQRFEDAAQIRNSFLNLSSILSHRHIISDKNPFILRHAKTSSELQHLVGATSPISTIEGYDISNISGTDATASLVFFENGNPNKNYYKRFKIHYSGISDFDMLQETLRRRLAHPEWPLPDAILIDGGKPQLRAVAKVLKAHFASSTWPFVLLGLSKAQRTSGAIKRKASGEEVLHIWPHRELFLKKVPQNVMHLLQAVRDESHRFAKKYHLLLRKRSLTPSYHTEASG